MLTVKVFHCSHCGHLLFFENVVCVRCGRAVAYVPELAAMLSLDLQEDGTWGSSTGDLYRLCDNYSKRNVCNWALPAADTNTFCRSCQLTRTIPNLTVPGNERLWYLLESAKRRVVYTLDRLRLSLLSREQPALEFEFLEDPAPGTDGSPVVTGHSNGTITVNIAEADEAERARRRQALGEPYRTLLGHFRHEIGHYYWDRLIRDSSRIEPFRALFGDERADYPTELARYYREGPPPGWENGFVSAYATMHPWEDWAETWAHYLHMADTLETAAACGIMIQPPRSDEPTLESVPDPVTDEKVSFDLMMEGWATITYVMNNLNRGLGVGDAYPFVLSARSIEKVRFVHETVAGT